MTDQRTQAFSLHSKSLLTISSGWIVYMNRISLGWSFAVITASSWLHSVNEPVHELGVVSLPEVLSGVQVESAHPGKPLSWVPVLR